MDTARVSRPNDRIVLVVSVLALLIVVAAVLIFGRPLRTGQEIITSIPLPTETRQIYQHSEDHACGLTMTRGGYISTQPPSDIVRFYHAYATHAGWQPLDPPDQWPIRNPDWQHVLAAWSIPRPDSHHIRIGILEENGDISQLNTPLKETHFAIQIEDLEDIQLYVQLCSGGFP